MALKVTGSHSSRAKICRGVVPSSCASPAGAGARQSVSGARKNVARRRVVGILMAVALPRRGADATPAVPPVKAGKPVTAWTSGRPDKQKPRHRTVSSGHIGGGTPVRPQQPQRSEEHTSELQSRLHLVCRLLLEKKKKSYVK